MSSDFLIELKNASVDSPQGNRLISEVTLQLKPQECVGIIGESGSGKTMTARALLGLLPQGLKLKAEALTLQGEDLMNLKEKDRRRRLAESVGFVPQNTVAYLHPLIRIRSQIIDGYCALGKGTAAEGLEKARALLEEVGITDARRVLNSYPGQLSGGMRQRVNIAMALMCDPQLILADEPTTALDCIVQKQVTELFFRLHQQRQVAILMISHNLNLLKNYCDRILVMYAGQIVEAGTAEEVFTHPRHPYTQALMALIPSLTQDPSQRLKEIPGYVPDQGRDSRYCLFRDRCPHRTSACEAELELPVPQKQHWARCPLAKGEIQ